MISLKRYIDTEHTSATLLRALVDAYQTTLATTAASALQACPSVEGDLEAQLTALGQAVAAADTPEAIDAANTRVIQRLEHWAGEAGDDLRKKTADVKELLVTLAHTAASVAASDAEHVIRFDALTARLQRIATLGDVTELRSAVLASAQELRASVESLSRSTRASLKELQTEIGTYQTKLEAAEKLAAHDPLTGLLNRRSVELTIERRILRGRPFSIGLIDLDGFKGINDRMGHRAGDDLLRQFSADLKANARPTDAVGRWGGDEFLVVVDGASGDAQAHFSRVASWVAGSYTVDGPQGTLKVHIDVSIGVSEWRPGLSSAKLVEEADARMYERKRGRR